MILPHRAMIFLGFRLTSYATLGLSAVFSVPGILATIDFPFPPPAFIFPGAGMISDK
jgi:hypothetical protein